MTKLRSYGLLDEFQKPNYGDYCTCLLILTTSCNLRCKYCLAGEGSYGIERTNMSREVIDSIIKFLAKKIKKFISKNKNVKATEMGLFFYGGEPLLCFDRIKYAVEKAKNTTRELIKQTGIKISPVFSISTNGTLINDEIAKFCKENNIEVIISIDGPEHDKYRIYANGKGSLRDVIRGFNILKKYRILTRVNSVIPSTEVHTIKKRIKWFKEKGMLDKSDKNIYVTFSFVRGLIGAFRNKTHQFHCYECPHDYNISAVKQLSSAIIKLVDQGYQTYDPEILRKIEMGGLYYKCLSGIERIAIMPDGSVYPCQSFIEKRFLLGNIKDKTFDNMESKIVKDFLMKRDIFSLEPCRNCYLQSICSVRFDCPSHSFYDHGGLFNVDKEACELGFEVQSKILKKIILEKIKSNQKYEKSKILPSSVKYKM
jgi:uncharacterized protein